MVGSISRSIEVARHALSRIRYGLNRTDSNRLDLPDSESEHRDLVRRKLGRLKMRAERIRRDGSRK